ncbi:hypothetical protein, partial [Roseomonas rosulenta]|uniref:hypothetical protein n=1 Tax=Roseomonas rosulenta TaxID=2748667 RepID=UPI0018DF7B47
APPWPVEAATPLPATVSPTPLPAAIPPAPLPATLPPAPLPAATIPAHRPIDFPLIAAALGSAAAPAAPPVTDATLVFLSLRMAQTGPGR